MYVFHDLMQFCKNNENCLKNKENFAKEYYNSSNICQLLFKMQTKQFF